MPSPVECPALAEFLQQLPLAKNLQRRHTYSIPTFLVRQFHRDLPANLLDARSLTEEAWVDHRLDQ